jgi:hypothetical protein
MPRLLKNLRIDEVSCVIKGANPGARVMIRKADGDAPYLFNDIMHKSADDDPDGDKVSSKLTAMVDAMIAAAPSLDRQEAAYYLLHNAHGRRLADHLNNISKTEKEIPMVDIFKLNNIDSVVEISKSIIDGKTDIDGSTYDQVLIGHAKQSKRSLESILTDPATPEIREAYALSKGYRPGATD